MRHFMTPHFARWTLHPCYILPRILAHEVNFVAYLIVCAKGQKLGELSLHVTSHMRSFRLHVMELYRNSRENFTPHGIEFSQLPNNLYVATNIYSSVFIASRKDFFLLNTSTFQRALLVSSDNTTETSAQVT